jgi:rhombotail lipoprotein
MYGIDVIALISYDQTRFTDRGVASISYWTIIGAYIVPGEKNDTHTMVDASVYDIKSRKMLFRAPGISHIKSKSTPVNLSEQIRIDSIEGFKQASEALIISLKEQLELFRERVNY